MTAECATTARDDVTAIDTTSASRKSSDVL
jgi:hypothetical protein